MQSRATYDDAKLILELYEMRREERMRKARSWFVASFRPRSAADLAALCPRGSDESASYRMVATYWEMVASFLTSGVLNKELFYQSGRELLLVWGRLHDVVAELREQQADPYLLRESRSRGEGVHRLPRTAGARRLRGVSQARQSVSFRR